MAPRSALALSRTVEVATRTTLVIVRAVIITAERTIILLRMPIQELVATATWQLMSRPLPVVIIDVSVATQPSLYLESAVAMAAPT